MFNILFETMQYAALSRSLATTWKFIDRILMKKLSIIYIFMLEALKNTTEIK